MDSLASGKVHGPRGDAPVTVHDTRTVASDDPNGGPNHLRAWRKFRRMTQQQLADKVDPPTTKQVIAALENGQNGLSAKWLRKLAAALNTRPGYLLDHDPNDLDTAWTEATDDVPPPQRPQAIRILKALSDEA